MTTSRQMAIVTTSSRMISIFRPTREIPDHDWSRVGLAAAVIVVVALVAWEFTVRAMGYSASYNDTPGLWGIARDRLKAHAEDEDVIAFVGASRIRFDLDHAIVSEAFGGAPIVNLSMNGSVARPVLADLANDVDFRGTALVGYTPILFWMPGGPLLEETESWLDQYDRRLPSPYLGQWLALGPESFLAFLQKDDLALAVLVRGAISALVPDRPGTQLPPKYPPYLAGVDFERRERMWWRLEQEEDRQRAIQEIWKGLFTMAQPLPPELLAKMRAEVAASVEAIRARGGEVVFIRFPSTGWLREFEEEITPRATHWEPLIEETETIGIHFEDYPELRDFDCPEWSHLTSEDAERFSRELVKILKPKLRERAE